MTLSGWLSRREGNGSAMRGVIPLIDKPSIPIISGGACEALDRVRDAGAR